MRDPCGLCGGSRRIRLGLRQPLTASYKLDVIEDPVGKSYRDYDCPECVKPTTPSDTQVRIARAQESIPSTYIGVEAVVDSVKKNLAVELAMLALREGMFTFEFTKSKSDEIYGSTAVTGTVGFVSPELVSTIEQRAAEKAAELLNGVAEEAAASISVWGRAYHGDDGPISKAAAMRFVREAFSKRLSKIKAQTAS